MVDKILAKVSQYAPGSDLSLVKKAFQYAQAAHEGQYRKSGEPYIIHPVEVAKILANLEMDIPSVCAGFLHDVVEDTPVTLEDIRREFGPEIEELVDGVTKLGKIDYRTKEETQAENLRKMFMAMGKDIRVILIKLADRLHNMRTLKYQSEQKAKEKAQETLEIFAPIANRLGISRIKWEMEDLALRYSEPEYYFELVEKVSTRRVEREAYIEDVIEILLKKLRDSSITCDITGRPKHFYSIYRKMRFQKKEFEEIYDLMAVRILVEDVRDCYGALGIVHTLWKPVPGRFKDYIAMPKPNMYQSLHTTVIGPNGEPLEIQIRTWEMHRTAEFGIAAHWKYKEGRLDTNESEMEKKLAWLRQMTEWQKEVSDPNEFLESLKIDLFSNEVFVFTPQGDVIELPADATPLDFAYKVHSAVGNKCIGAKINGRIVPLDSKLLNGDIVEILTSSASPGPSRDWLKIVKSSQAKNKIRQWFKKERREENIEKGREMIEREAKRQGYPLAEFMRQKNLQAVSKALNQPNEEDLLAALGYGGLTMSQIIPRLKERFEAENSQFKEEKIQKVIDNNSRSYEEAKKRTVSNIGVHVIGIDNILIRLAKCCNPLPGDPIVGYITKGRGVSVHRTDCTHVHLETNHGEEKIVPVEWDSHKQNKSFETGVSVRAIDRKGLFNDVSGVFAANKIPVNGINARTNKEGWAVMQVVIEISDKEQLSRLISQIRQIEGVLEVDRQLS